MKTDGKLSFWNVMVRRVLLSCAPACMTDRIKTAIAKKNFLISEYWFVLIKSFAFIPYYVTTSKKVTNCVKKK